MITMMCVICIFSGPVVSCVSDSDINIVSTPSQDMMASLIDNFLNTVISDEEEDFPSNFGEDDEEDMFERAAEEFLRVLFLSRFTLMLKTFENLLGIRLTPPPELVDEESDVPRLNPTWKLAVSDAEEDPEVPFESNSYSDVNEIRESMAFLDLLPPELTDESDLVDSLPEAAVEELGGRGNLLSQSVDRPLLQPSSHNVVPAEGVANLIEAEQLPQTENALPRRRRRDIFRSRHSSVASQDRTPRVRKRDQLRAKLRRIAFSESEEEDATATHVRRRHRLIAKIQSLLSQRTQASGTVTGEKSLISLIPRNRFESLK